MMWMVVREEGRKQFFFAKKNQKTVGPCRVVLRVARRRTSVGFGVVCDLEDGSQRAEQGACHEQSGKPAQDRADQEVAVLRVR